jgi:hypothetical protein
MRKLLPVILTVFLTASLSADDGSGVHVYDVERGGTVFALQKNDDIVMSYELIAIFPENYRTSDDYTNADSGSFIVECWFDFTNTRNRPVKVKMGFPEVVRKTYGTEWNYETNERVMTDGYTNSTGFSDFKTKIGGKTVESKRSEGRGFDYFWTFPVDFEPNETLTIFNSYRQEPWTDRDGSASMQYILETGATWKNAIGTGNIMFITGGDVHYVSFENLEPTGSDNLKFNYFAWTPEMPHILTSTYLSGDEKYSYTANCARDGSPSTAWVEGLKGYGEGAWIVLKTPKINSARVNEVSGIKVMNGYQNSETEFKINSRVKTAKVVCFTLSDEADFMPQGDEDRFKALVMKCLMGKQGKLVTSIHNETVEIADTMGWQEVTLAEDVRADYVALQITEAWPGSKYEDTCISEIEVLPAEKTPYSAFINDESIYY